MKPTKESLIDQILENPVYQPTSGLSVQLYAALSKMSKVNLQQLLTVIKLKEGKHANDQR